MKHNPKESINIIELVDEFIIKLNKACSENNIDKIYSIRIINDKFTPSIEEIQQGAKARKTKCIQFHVVHTETNNRILLYDNHLIMENPADALKKPYKRILYREFLYNNLGVFAFNMETTIINDRLSKQEKNTEELVRPLTEGDSLNPNDFAG